MATPVGHGLAGLTVGVAGGESGRVWRYALLGLVAGLAPDLDFVPGLLAGDPARFHHGPTHSLAAALFAGVVVLVLGPPAGRWRAGLVAAGGYLSHLVLDLVTADPSPPRGVPLLWPILDGPVQSPVTLLPRVLHSVVSPFNLHNVHVAAVETAVFGGLLVAVLVLGRRRVRGPRGPT